MLELPIAKFQADDTAVISAITVVVVALVIAKLVDYLVGRHAKSITKSVTRGELSPIAITRLRLVRRLVFAAIVVIGAGLAISQFADLQRIAAGVLASSAVVGIVIGFAARQTIANAMAGLMIAIVQPIRIGDVVEWEGQRGVVVDITLSYTFIRTPNRRRLIVPNEQIASGSILNYTIAGDEVSSTASIWVSPEHAHSALGLLRDGFDSETVAVGSVDATGVELTVTTTSLASDEADTAAGIREQAIRILDSAGKLKGPSAA